MTHIGQELALGTGGRLGSLFRSSQLDQNQSRFPDETTLPKPRVLTVPLGIGEGTGQLGSENCNGRAGGGAQ